MKETPTTQDQGCQFKDLRLPTSTACFSSLAFATKAAIPVIPVSIGFLLPCCIISGALSYLPNFRRAWNQDDVAYQDRPSETTSLLSQRSDVSVELTDVSAGLTEDAPPPATLMEQAPTSNDDRCSTDVTIYATSSISWTCILAPIITMGLTGAIPPQSDIVFAALFGAIADVGINGLLLDRSDRSLFKHGHSEEKQGFFASCCRRKHEETSNSSAAPSAHPMPISMPQDVTQVSLPAHFTPVSGD